MQLSDLLPAVGELIPYDYETIRTPEYETLLAGLLAGAVSQTAPHFVQIGGHSRCRQNDILQKFTLGRTAFYQF